MFRKQHSRGFTLLELLVVVMIILVIAAMAIPQILQAVYNLRLRSAASEVSGMLQLQRMRAIRDNRTYPMSCTPQPLNACQIFFVDTQNPPVGTGIYVPADGTAVSLPGTVRFSTAGFPPLPANLLPYNPSVTNPQPYFNARGLPCVMVAGVCTPMVNGFVYYLTDQRPLGNNGYVALTVTPAGRIRIYTWGCNNQPGGWCPQ